MSDKSNFTLDEWKLLLESVMVAGIAVSAAEETGAFTLTWNRNAPPPEPPYNVVEPTITGTPKESATLTGSDGEWYGTPPLTFTYFWWRCSTTCERIAGATAKSYLTSELAQMQGVNQISGLLNYM